MQWPEYFDHHSERLNYRAVETDDIEAWEEFFHNNDFIPYLGIPDGLSPIQMAEKWIHIQLDRYAKFGLGHLAVIEKQSGSLIGMTGILPRTVDDEECYEIAYSLIPAYWGNGYATEMAQHMQATGRQLGISDTFVSLIHVENRPSMKVAEKCGMTSTRSTRFLDMDVIIYSTLDNG